MAAVGLLVGLVGSLVATRLMQSLLFGVAAFDPVTLFAVAVGVLVVAGVSSSLPAVRAAGLDPIQAMR
jgi:ABC-type antimicrobial peptide transport system permease subunit